MSDDTPDVDRSASRPDGGDGRYDPYDRLRFEWPDGPGGGVLLIVLDDPERLNYPMKRVGSGFERIGWEQALSEIGARVRELRKELVRLRMENEILKKAAAYFAKESL